MLTDLKRTKEFSKLQQKIKNLNEIIDNASTNSEVMLKFFRSQIMEGLAAKENEIYANIENNTQAQEYQNTLLSESLVKLD